MSLERFVVNFGGAAVRREKLEGRDHYVAPAAMIAEGVWEGSGGPLFYAGEDLGGSSPSWNYKPIVVYHPKDKDGRHVSACAPNVLNTRKVGVILNTRYDGKLRAECWFDIERTKAVDGRIITALEANRPLEGSTGVFVDNDGTAGEYNGKPYVGRAGNFRPDHFAVLPDQKGAYSVADGGGVLTVNVAGTEPERVQTVLRRGVEKALAEIGASLTANELSFDERCRQLCDLLSEKYGRPGKYWNGHVHAVYNKKVVFCNPDDGGHDRMFEIGYTTKDDTVALAGDAVEVERVVEYRPVGNSNQGETTMAFDKKAHIAGLIGNGWEEADRPVLEALPDAQLEKIKPAKSASPTPTPVVVVNTETVMPGKVVDTAEPPAPAKQTIDEVIGNSSPEVQAEFKAQRRMASRYAAWENKEKEKAVAIITANGRVKFKKEFLMAKDLEELQALAQLAGPTEEEIPAGAARFDFGAGAEEPVANAEPPKPLTRVRTFGKAETNGAAK